MPRSIKAIPIDIRSKRVRGGRLAISSGTTVGREAAAREQTLRDLINEGRTDIIERIRSGELHIAQVHAAVRKGRVEDLQVVTDSDITLEAALARVIARAEGGGVDGTIKHRRHLAAQFRKHFPDARLSDIGTEQAEQFVFGIKKSDKPWSLIRQEQARQMGLEAWDVAINSERERVERDGGKPRLTLNPWRNIKVVGGGKKSVHRPAFLTREQWATLERENRDLPELALCALGALGGLRKGEAVHLRIGQDVDMQARTIRVQARKGKHAWKPKTPRSVRTVPMCDGLHAILTRHIELGYAGQLYLIRLNGKVDEPLKHVTPANWTERAFTRAGITYGREHDGFTHHTLRHTFASWLAQANVQLQIIAELMGDTVKTVVDYYAHLVPQSLSTAVRVLDEKGTE